MPEDQPAPLLGDLTVAEAADLLGVHPRTLLGWVDDGVVPCVRTPGGHHRFHRQALEQFARTRMTGPTQEAS